MDEKLKEFIAKQEQIINSIFEQSRSYVNIIMMGGYAGLFAVWNFTKDDLVHWQSMTVGLLITLSILSFVLFEIYGGWLRTTQVFGLTEQLEKAKQMEKFPDDYGKQEQERAKIMKKVWPFFFFVTLTSGILAGIILLYSFVTSIMNA